MDNLIVILLSIKLFDTILVYFLFKLHERKIKISSDPIRVTIVSETAMPIQEGPLVPQGIVTKTPEIQKVRDIPPEVIAPNIVKPPRAAGGLGTKVRDV
jgi:hypothetical protein